MSKETENSALTITGDSLWWKNAANILIASTQSSRDSSETVSFLSCVLIDHTEDGTFLHTESEYSTSYITVDNEEVKVEGEPGKYLIKATALSSQLSSFPDDGDIVLVINDKGEYTLSMNDGEITFNSLTETILNDDALPNAENDFPKDCLVFTSDVSSITQGYKMGSSMVKPKDKDISTNYDTLSGCLVTLSSDGMFIMSASASSAETHIQGDVKKFGKIEKKKKPEFSALTVPDSMQNVLSKFNSSSEVEVCIDEDGFTHIDDGVAHVVVSPLNTHASKIKLNYELIMGVMNPVWENRVVTVELPSKQLKEALSRSGSVHADIINMAISASNVKITSINSDEIIKNPFTQKIACSTQWHDDEENFFEINIRHSILKRVYTLSPSEGEFIFDVAVNPKTGNPWAIVVHTGTDFDPEKPHNFFVLNAVQR